MLPIVARSASGMLARPGPKNSTNLPTTPRSRSIWVTVSTRSVAVAPSGSSFVHPEAHHLGQQHRHRLAQHRGLGLDAAHAPAQHAEAVDHRGVRVGAHQRVGEGLAVAGGDHARQVLQVHLVADAGVGRHHREVVERRLAPAQERVALLVALELQLGVLLERHLLGEGVDLDRVVDHQLDRHQRVDLGGIAAQLLHGVAHGGQVDDGGHAGEVLHQHAAGRVGDLDRRLVGGHPLGHRLDRVLGDRLAVLVAQQVLQQHLQRVGQARHVELATGARRGGRSRARCRRLPGWTWRRSCLGWLTRDNATSPAPPFRGWRSCAAPALAATTSAMATHSRACSTWPSTTRPREGGHRGLQAHQHAEHPGGQAAQRLQLQRVGDGRREDGHAGADGQHVRLQQVRAATGHAEGHQDRRGEHHGQRQPLHARERLPHARAEQDVAAPEHAGQQGQGRRRWGRCRRRRRWPAARCPAAARVTHSRSSGRREPSTATVRGPANSIVTATPWGMRSIDS